MENKVGPGSGPMTGAPTVAEVCRRLRHVRRLLCAAGGLPAGQEDEQLKAFEFARHYLSATQRKLGALLDQLASPAPRHVDDELTRPCRLPPPNG